MKVAEARKLIGKRVEWRTRGDPNRGTYFVRSGVIVEVAGKNVRIESMGSDDWRWLPDLIDLKEVPAATAQTENTKP